MVRGKWACGLRRAMRRCELADELGDLCLQQRDEGRAFAYLRERADLVTGQ
jgi:hypothetical protein